MLTVGSVTPDGKVIVFPADDASLAWIAELKRVIANACEVLLDGAVLKLRRALAAMAHVASPRRPG
jgi:hypothetical protein